MSWYSARRFLAAALALTMASSTACSTLSTGPTDNLGIPSQVEGIPDVVLRAYGQAAAAASEIAPECTGMTWALLAGIGQEESKHGVYYGGAFDSSGTVAPPIIGVALNGGVINDRGDTVQSIPDTDGGRYDNDPVWDRAVGPMQFIPGTWQHWAPSATGVERPDPQNIFHATLTAAAYLCGRDPVDLTDQDTLEARIRAYNNSAVYVADVIANMEEYAAIPVTSGGPGNVPDLTGIPPGEIGPCEETTSHTSATPLACASRDAAIRAFPGAQWTKAGSAYCLRSTADDHGAGIACDLMTSGIGTLGSAEQQAAGDQLAWWYVSNHEALGVRYVIWKQSIWHIGYTSASCASQQWHHDLPDIDVGKWCGMNDRGSITENHYDHVHITYNH